MDYGVRRYEAAQRLMWFLFFLICLALAYPIVGFGDSFILQSQNAAPVFQPEALKSLPFWKKPHWIDLEPLGKVISYFAYTALFFLVGRAVWILLQFLGTFIIGLVLSSTIKKKTPVRARPGSDGYLSNPESAFPAKLLLKRIDYFVLQFVFHSYQRLRLMLFKGPHKTLSSEELVERERRIVESDWEIFDSAWGPYRWVVWTLPVLAIIQTAWLLYLQAPAAIAGQKEIHELFGAVLNSFVPLAQIIALTAFFRIACALVRRIEELYLSNIDALLYDRFLAHLPLQSNDTMILLEALQRHFEEMSSNLRKLEKTVSSLKRDRDKMISTAAIETPQPQSATELRTFGLEEQGLGEEPQEEEN